VNRLNRGRAVVTGLIGLTTRPGEVHVFNTVDFHATLPAADLERAKSWYEEKLGLRPVEEDVFGGVWYETGGTRFLLYTSAFAGTNQATAVSFSFEGFDAAMGVLRSRGVTFDEFDYGDVRTENGVMELPDGRRGAWFKDSEGNILSILSG
jgi:catechol 2,3-dioxygenase-like lactoylglutathione lyase family enzyme